MLVWSASALNVDSDLCPGAQGRPAGQGGGRWDRCWGGQGPERVLTDADGEKEAGDTDLQPPRCDGPVENEKEENPGTETDLGTPAIDPPWTSEPSREGLGALCTRRVSPGDL